MDDGGIGMIGIIGGNGMLGRALAAALLRRGGVVPGDLWISCRSGVADDVAQGVRITADNRELVDACDTVILCVPPQAARDLDIHADGRLVVSVMAGQTLARIADLSGTSRVIRAMTSPAAAEGLAFSPWCAHDTATLADRHRATAILRCCGTTAELPSEDQLDIFTALTGPVPGFVAFFAACVSEYAVSRGVDPELADLATRQLFLGAGHMLAKGGPSAADHVAGMTAYAGTTAAGLKWLQASGIAAELAEGLDASVDAARRLGGG